MKSVNQINVQYFSLAQFKEAKALAESGLGNLDYATIYSKVAKGGCVALEFPTPELAQESAPSVVDKILAQKSNGTNVTAEHFVDGSYLYVRVDWPRGAGVKAAMVKTKPKKKAKKGKTQKY